MFCSSLGCHFRKSQNKIPMHPKSPTHSLLCREFIILECHSTAYKKNSSTLPGQQLVLQTWVSVASTGKQSAPPFSAGASCTLDLFWVPPPQVTSQDPQAVHADHVQSTLNKTIEQLLMHKGVAIKFSVYGAVIYLPMQMSQVTGQK